MKGVPSVGNQENARWGSMELPAGQGIVVVVETLENT